MRPSLINANHKIVTLDSPCIRISDRGFSLGHGLFETILANKGTLPFLPYHWQRLQESASLIDIALPFCEQTLTTMIKELIFLNHLQNEQAIVRITLTHGEATRGLLPAEPPTSNFFITVFPMVPLADAPFTAMIVKTKKNEHSITSKIKSLSYLDNILAKQEAQKENYDEAILLNTASNVADGAISNVYLVKNRQIMTPPISDGALPGVIRGFLLKELAAMFPIDEKSLSPNDFLAADEVFLTNSLIGVKAVKQLNHKIFSCFEITHKIKKEFQIRMDFATS
ncbi:MAG: aminotransferase class IV [Silvanigrellaceae bacterium]|nr:aminotransferase class IV [Silvanigrellaceae bacterium]